MASWYPDAYRRMREQLAEARKRAQLSQSEVARRLGMPQQHISRVESGDRRIDPMELQAFARLYGVPITAFFEEGEQIASTG